MLRTPTLNRFAADSRAAGVFYRGSATKPSKNVTPAVRPALAAAGLPA